MTHRPHIVVVGDAVLDSDLEGHVTRVCPDAPVPVVDVDEERSGPGGAGLTALLCAEDDAQVTLVAPLGDDEAGTLLQQQLSEAGVSVVGLRQEGETRRKTRVRAAGQSLLRVDSGGPARPSPELPLAAAEAIELADVVLVSCYGAGTTDHPALRETLARRAQRRPVVWDPHPRGGIPVPGCALVSPNLGEARGQLDLSGTGEGPGADGVPGDVMAARLRDRWSARAVAVTAGSRGAWLATSVGEPLFVPATPVAGDSCGAGDRFAAAAAVALAQGRTASESVVAAVEAATAFVAASGASGFRRRLVERRAGAGGRQGPRLGDGPMEVPTSAPAVAADAQDLVQAVRAAGGTVVATGGCFDVLHAGHVQTLRTARQLGDALVVLLNSDDSVRRLKGPERPVQPEQDRAEVLRSLGCVDAVVVFDEDDPSAALAALRPDVWAKGGDYEGAELAEGDLVRSWGGRVVLLPYLTGRSTTAILQRDLTGVQHDRA